MHGARAAQGLAAAIFGAAHLQRVAQRPKQRGIGRDIELLRRAIDSQFDHLQAPC